MESGLYCVYDETKDSSHEQSTRDRRVVDIIAVHGLGANPDYAWIRKEDTATGGLEGSVHWLRDLLPATLRHGNPSVKARIFCFNYKSRWIGANLEKMHFARIADAMLDCIANENRNSGTNGRPLIFVGHSFGGLVIEKAIVRASVDQGPYRGLVDALRGVILLGTPHRGSNIQKVGSILSQCAALCNYGESHLIVLVDETSVETKDMIHDFVKIMIQKGLMKARAVVCFFENRKTNIGRRLPGKPSLNTLVSTDPILTM
ncbi:hypothetical protein NHJ13051_009881 [Beauveria bassiana]